jgi:hypothetical protein
MCEYSIPFFVEFNRFETRFGLLRGARSSVRQSVWLLDVSPSGETLAYIGKWDCMHEDTRWSRVQIPSSPFVIA